LRGSYSYYLEEYLAVILSLEDDTKYLMIKIYDIYNLFFSYQ